MADKPDNIDNDVDFFFLRHLLNRPIAPWNVAFYERHDIANLASNLLMFMLEDIHRISGLTGSQD